MQSHLRICIYHINVLSYPILTLSLNVLVERCPPKPCTVELAVEANKESSLRLATPFLPALCHSGH